MINKIPFIGWFFAGCAAVGLAVPFWLCWTAWDIGETYFDFLPEKYQSIPFWDCVGLFIVISIIKGTITPRIFSVSNEQKVEKQ